MLLWEHMAWLKAGNKHVDSPIEERLKDQNLKLSDFNMHRMLGKGQFGRVLLVSSKLTGRKYALKILSKAMVVEEGQVRLELVDRNSLHTLNGPVGCCPFSLGDTASCVQSRVLNDELLECLYFSLITLGGFFMFALFRWWLASVSGFVIS